MVLNTFDLHMLFISFAHLIIALYVCVCMYIWCSISVLKFLCMLWIPLHHHVWFAHTSSQSVDCLFISFTWAFTRQKLFILMQFYLSVFILWVMLLVSSLRTFCLALDTADFLLCFWFLAWEFCGFMFDM